MATAAAVTAEDVAFELVATKIAISSLIEDVTGQGHGNFGQREWAEKSPVPLPGQDDEIFWDRLHDRVEEISASIMEALGNHFIERAVGLRSIKDEIALDRARQPRLNVVKGSDDA